MVNLGRAQLKKLEVTQREMTIVNKLAGIIAFNSDINAGFQDFVDELRKIVDVDWACIVLTMDVRAYFCALSSKIGSSWKVGDTVYIEGKDAAWLSAINEALTKGSLAEEDKLRTNENYRKQLLRSILYNPLLSDGGAFGVLIIASTRPDAYGEKESLFLNHIADEIAIPVWKSVLLTKGTELIAAICQLTTLIGSDAKLDKVLAPLAQEIKKFVSFGHLYTTWIEGEKFAVQPILPEMETTLQTLSTYALKGSAIGWVVNHKSTLIQRDIAKKKRFSTDFIKPKKNLGSLIHVPLFSDDEVFAVITLSSTQPDTYGAREQEMLEQICVQIAGTIKIAHLYALEREKRIKLEMEEKERLQFLNALAHELKTPVTAVVATVGLLIEELDAKTQSPAVRLTQTIIRAIHKLEARLSELLDMARLGTLTFELNLELLDVRPLLQNVVSEQLPFANEKNQSISLDIPSSVPMVLADHRRLEQIVVNLITNAIKFSGENGKIQIKLRRQSDKLVVVVKDDGPGVSEEEQERIFQPYYRIEADRQRFPGLGLGLALSKQLAERHGGSMWIESTAGKGSIFIFSLPIGE
jgi:signal transduction histidine kinase